MDPFLKVAASASARPDDYSCLVFELSRLPREVLEKLAGLPSEPPSSAEFEQMKVAMQKAAFGALGTALVGAAKGVGSFAAKAAPGLQRAYAKKGLSGAATALRGFGSQGIRQAGTWASKNPGAAAAIGAGALGAAGATGYALG